MTQTSVSRIGLLPQSLRHFSLLALFVLLALTAACSNAKQNSATDSTVSSSPAVASSTASGAGGNGNSFEGTITAKMFAGNQPKQAGQAIDLKYAIKGARTRVETQLAQGGTAIGIVLMDLSSGTQTMLVPQTKTYMTMNWKEDGQFKEMVERMAKEAGQGGAGDLSKVTTNGKTETIAGHSCQHWLMGDKQQTDVCLAKGLGYFGGGGQSGGIFDNLKSLGLGEKVKAQLDANPEFAKFVEGGAFPLKIAQVENGQSKTIMEVTSIERKALDDELFAVPADYKKMEIPKMTGNK